MPDKVVLDTSAIIAWLANEPGAARIGDILQRAKRSKLDVFVAFISLMEAEYILMRRSGRSKALEGTTAIEGWPMQIVESHPDWRHRAAALKARGGLSLADAWIASLALELDAELVHKDREFDAVPGLRSVRL